MVFLVKIKVFFLIHVSMLASGLGEMIPLQLWETTLNPEKRPLKQLVVEDAAEANVVFSSLMGVRVSIIFLKDILMDSYCSCFRHVLFCLSTYRLTQGKRWYKKQPVWLTLNILTYKDTLCEVYKPEPVVVLDLQASSFYSQCQDKLGQDKYPLFH